MKRLLLTFVLIIAVTTSIFALDAFYMAPYGATIVNLDASQEWRTLRNAASHNQDYGVFPDEQRIMIGGLENLKIDGVWAYIISNTEFQRYGIRLTFSSDSFDEKTNYFWFIKQSDPEFRRPFQIQVTERVYQAGFGSESYYHSFGLMGDEGTEELEADSIRDFGNIIEEVFGGLIGKDVSYNVAFEFGIILPGDINNGVLTLDDGTTYPIASGIDYSAEIEVTATLINIKTNTEVSGYAPITFTVPISGYYDPRYSDGTENPDVDTSASLYVTPYARAANIDLLNDQGKTDIPIANVDFSIYDLTENFTSGQYDESVFIFLSANSNPFAQDENGFRFVHESVGFGDAELPTNSLGYTITASGTSDTTANGGSGSVTFDGTDYLTPDGSTPDDRILTAHHDMAIGDLFGGGKAHWHSWNGELLLSLDTNNRIMNEGLYKSTVYVHVVTDDSPGGTT